MSLTLVSLVHKTCLSCFIYFFQNYSWLCWFNIQIIIAFITIAKINAIIRQLFKPWLNINTTYYHFFSLSIIYGNGREVLFFKKKITGGWKSSFYGLLGYEFFVKRIEYPSVPLRTLRSLTQHIPLYSLLKYYAIVLLLKAILLVSVKSLTSKRMR